MVVGVPLGNPQLALGAGGVPADKHDRIVEVVPRTTVAGAVFVLAPHRVLRLGIAIRRADPAPGNHPQQIVARGQGVFDETAFLLDDRHRHVGREAPGLFHFQRIFVPVRVLAVDAANIALLTWRCRRAPGQQGQCDE
ncbi:hypothetical protein D3C71_1201870 [compost metagenome]